MTNVLYVYVVLTFSLVVCWLPHHLHNLLAVGLQVPRMSKKTIHHSVEKEIAKHQIQYLAVYKSERKFGRIISYHFTLIYTSRSLSRHVCRKLRSETIKWWSLFRICRSIFNYIIIIVSYDQFCYCSRLFHIDFRLYV